MGEYSRTKSRKNCTNEFPMSQVLGNQMQIEKLCHLGLMMVLHETFLLQDRIGPRQENNTK